jgi:glutamate carboxypeptidase
MNELLRFCESERRWLLETVAALAALESPSTDKAAVDRCGRELSERLASLGGDVSLLRQERRGDHVRAEFKSSSTALAPVLLLGHFDTVWDVGQLARMPLHETEGRLHGPGVFDMKSGIAIAMLAVRALAQVGGAPPIVMLWTSDEEIGSETSRTAVEDEARRSQAVLVIEPSLPGGAVKTSRKGVGEFELRVRGIAAHAGLDPGNGASAVLELAHQILAIDRLQSPDRGITANVGVVSGGSRANVVPEAAHAVIDVRVPTATDARDIVRELRGLRPHLRGTSLELTGGINRPPFERTEEVGRLYRIAREVARQLGRDLGEGGAGGGSDGNFTGSLGVPTLDGLGPAGGGAHALTEHVIVADLPWRAALLGGLLARLGSRDADEVK